MDMLIALENIAQASATAGSNADVSRWMQLFGYSAAQAEKAIETHFQDLSRIIVSDDYWDIVRNTTDAQGHDQESYAHHLMHHASSPSTLQQPFWGSSNTKKKMAGQYLVEIVEGLTAADIQAIAGLSQPPKVVTNDSGDRNSAIVDASTMLAIERSLPLGFFSIPLSAPAAKDLSNTSIAPTLGVEATLPQHRIGNNAPSPLQSEYPVCYFFYGTLARPDRLSRLLDLDYKPSLRAAVISRGKTKKWGNYYALVDGKEDDRVEGWLYNVHNKEQEDELRRYESSNYEVVRCKIEAGVEVVYGLTFRFCGDKSELV